MITERELLEAIERCKKDPVTYANIEKLANLFIVYDHLYGEAPVYDDRRITVENIIGHHGDSDFLVLVNEKSADKVWKVIDELLETIKVINPRLYDGVLRKIDD